ncbi:MAG: ABC transporter permease, partial [Planctomycetes bacterium]|nr:ABC transporter permease [Planctomycetota bacterium]
MILIRVLFQTVFLAIGQIWSNKIRSMLTTLGIIIGVAAVIAVVGVLSGLEQQVLDQFEKFGTKRVFIGGKRPEGIRGHRAWREVQLTIEEVQAIDEHVESLTKVVPMWSGSYRIENGDRSIESVRVAGIWPQWHDIENRQILTGRPFSPLDEELRRQVCLINEMAIEELNLNQDPIGDFILLAGRRFHIVGIVETIEL